MADVTGYTQTASNFMSKNWKYIVGGLVVLAVIYYFYNQRSAPYGEGFDAQGLEMGPYPVDPRDPRDLRDPRDPRDLRMLAMRQKMGSSEMPQQQQPVSGAKKLVLFYAPWCPHCTTIKGKEGDQDSQVRSPWGQLKAKYGQRPDLQMEEIDCDKQPEKASQYGIGGFPTIMLFTPRGQSYTYDGDRSVEDIERFVNSY